MEMENLEVYVNISKEEFSLVCRICLTKGELRPFNNALSSLFFALTDIQVRSDDNLPNNICLECISKLQEISRFIESSKLTDAGLQRIIRNQAFSEEYKETMDNNFYHEKIEFIVEDMVDQSINFEMNEKVKSEDNDSFDNCDTGLKMETEVEKVLTFTSDSNQFDCSHCNKRFSSENELVEHLVSHCNKQFFECKLCGKKFKARHNLQRHTNSEHKKLKAVRCEICQQDIDGDVAEHIKIHFKEDQENEGAESTDNQSADELFEFIYEDNVTDNLDDIEIRSTESEQTENKYICDICNKSFRHAFKLKLHMRRHGGEGLFDCNKCYRKYLTESALQEHQIDHDADAEDYTCAICGKIYKMRDKLALHMKTHSEKKPYDCKECGKCFKILFYYNQHMKNHKARKDFLCSVCGKNFTTARLLEVHTRIHDGHRPFICELCGKRYTQSSPLNVHMKKHRGERNYRCTICDRTFMLHHHLQDHVKLIHTKEKDFKCRYCDKEFGLKSALNRHHLIHTGVRPHKCSACGAGFCETRQLRNHIKRCSQSA